MDFEGSHQNTFNIDSSMKDKGLLFDGFTYHKPMLSSALRKDDENGSNLESLKEVVKDDRETNKND